METKYDYPFCVQCGTRKYYKSGTNKDGSPRFAKKCDKCRRPNIKRKSKPGNIKKKYKVIMAEELQKLICYECGFKAVDVRQLDVDHIDGDHSNNDPSNLQILCANCHRLKTKVNKDYLKNS